MASSLVRVLPLLVVLLVATVLRAPAFFQPPWYLDEGIFASITEVWRGGGALYTDAWDNKPPGIFVVYALGWSTGLDMVAVRVLDLGAMLGVIALVYVMARRAGGDIAGLVAATTAGLLLGLPTIEGHIANTESFFILFTTLGMFLVLRSLEQPRRDAFIALAGLSFGVACMFKQVAVFDVLTAALFLGLVHRGLIYRASVGRATVWRRLVWLGAGLAILPLATASLFLIFGSFSDLWFATVGSLAGYRGDSPDAAPGRFLVALLPLALALPFALSLTPWRTRAPEAMFVLWLAFTAIAVSASGRAYPHYFIQMAPPFALVAGLIASPAGARLPRTSAALGLIVASLAISHVLLGPWPNLAWNQEPQYTRDYYGNFFDYASGEADREAYEAFFDSRAYAHLGLYDEIEEAGLRSQAVFVWGDVPWLYVEAGLDNPTRYTTLLNAREVEGSDEAVAELLLQAGAGYVLVMEETRASWEQVQPLLGGRYVPIAEMQRSVLYGHP